MSAVPSREDEHYKARRCLRLWPVLGSSEKDIWNGTQEFYPENLGVSDVKVLDIITIRRIKSVKRSVAHNKVYVQFGFIEVRDDVYRNANKLSSHFDVKGHQAGDP